MAYLFEKEEGSNIGVDRIHSEDAMINWWTYQHLIDIAICNCHKPVTEMALRKELKAQHFRCGRSFGGKADGTQALDGQCRGCIEACGRVGSGRRGRDGNALFFQLRLP